MGRTIIRALEERGVFNDLERFRVLWCRTMHDDISWPRSGQYQCRTCGRYYPVPWGAHEVYAHPPAIPALDHAHGVAIAIEPHW